MLEEFLKHDVDIQKNNEIKIYDINCLLCKYNCNNKCYHEVKQINKHPCCGVCDFYKRDYSKKI